MVRACIKFILSTATVKSALPSDIPLCASLCIPLFSQGLESAPKLVPKRLWVVCRLLSCHEVGGQWDQIEAGEG